MIHLILLFQLVIKALKSFIPSIRGAPEAIAVTMSNRQMFQAP